MSSLRKMLINGNYKFKKQIKKLSNLFKKSILLNHTEKIKKIALIFKIKYKIKSSFKKHKIVLWIRLKN